jgi:hypothetical protein
MHYLLEIYIRTRLRKLCVSNDVLSCKSAAVCGFGDAKIHVFVEGP